MNRIHVGLKSVRGDLELALCRFIDLLGEGKRVSRRSPSEMPRQHKFCLTLDCDEAISVPKRGVSAHVVLFFASHESPNFIALNISHGQAVDRSFKKPLAVLASKY
jgi:hypothetical protein